MNETKLADRLHDLGSEVPVDLERSAPRTLRRARVRRGAAAFAASVVVVAIVLGGVAVLRVAAPEGADGPNPNVPLTEGPTPVLPTEPAFAGLWPETTPEALTEAQAAVDDGHQPLRLDPEQTAVMLATNLFGWEYEQTLPRTVGSTDQVTTVELRNSSLGDDIPATTVEVAQLGRAGPDGIWSIVSVSSPLLGEWVWTVEGADEAQAIVVPGTLEDAPAGSGVRYFFRGDGGQVDGPSGAAVIVDGDRFEFSWPVAAGPPAGAVMWVHVVDASDVDVTLGANAIPVAGAVGPRTPDPTYAPSLDFTDLPPGVAVTAQRIIDAARAGDVDTLGELVDPDRFTYNFGGVPDPVSLWREDPSVLDPIPAMLTLPYVVEDIKHVGTFYIWPSLTLNSSLDEISEQERADLHALGLSDADIELMQESGSYLGPRLAIDETGVWRYYVTGGD